MTDSELKLNANPNIQTLEDMATPVVKQAIHTHICQGLNEKYGKGKWTEKKFQFLGFYKGIRKDKGVSFETGDAEYDLPDFTKLNGVEELFWTDQSIINTTEREIMSHPFIDQDDVRTFKWGLTEGIKLSAKAKVSLPLIGDAEISSEVDLGSQQEWVSTSVKHMGNHFDVPVPANYRLTCEFYFTKKEADINWQIPVILTCMAWAKMDVKAPGSYDYIDMCSPIAHFLAKEQNRFMIKGYIKGGVGFDGTMKFHSEPLNAQTLQAANGAQELKGDSLTEIIRIEPA